MNTVIEYYQYFKKDLVKLTNDELVNRFNREVGIRAFGIARQGYLWALEEEFDKRKIDYSNIGNNKSISYKYVVFLKGKKLYCIN